MGHKRFFLHQSFYQKFGVRVKPSIFIEATTSLMVGIFIESFFIEAFTEDYFLEGLPLGMSRSMTHR